MKRNLPLISAEFVVAGMDFDPNECTTHFGIKPTEVLIKGEKQRGFSPPAPQSSWCIKSKRERMDSSNPALQYVTEIIWSNRAKIKEYSRKNKLQITFVLKIIGGLGRRNFLYEFTPKVLKQLSYFEAPLYIDPY
jgi:hypothetical protein